MIKLTSRNVIFNGSLFVKYDTVIGFMASEWVWEWSRFLILSPSWPYTQNVAQLNWYFHSFSQKTWLFVNDFKHRLIIYCWKSFFVIINNSRSLPQNKALFGSDLPKKFRHFAQKNVPIILSLSSRRDDTIMMKRLRGSDLHRGWSSKVVVFPCSSSTTAVVVTRLHDHKQLYFTANKATCNYFSIFLFIPNGACSTMKLQ